MNLLRYYSVFTRQLVPSLGSNPKRVNNPFMLGFKARRGNSISHLFHAFKSHEMSENLSTNQDSSDVNTFAITEEIERNGFGSSQNIYGYITASSKTCLTDILRSRVSCGFADVSSSISYLVSDDFQPQGILCTQPQCGLVESNQHLFFSSVITGHKYCLSYSVLGLFFLSQLRGTNIACPIVPTIRSD